ncbi:MAG: RHS repeat-associated core domain-containing protein, partial [Phycisphaerae bacterium]
RCWPWVGWLTTSLSSNHACIRPARLAKRTPVTMGYDANGNRTNMADSLGAATYSYDSLNRLTNVTDCYGKTVGYSYDKSGNRTSVTYPGNKTVTCVYDSMNRLARVTDWLSHMTTYNYDPDGNLTNAVNPNGTAASYGYGVGNRLASLTNSGPNSAIISRYAYTLDPVGNHTQVEQVEPLPAAPVRGQFSYAYDNDNRMIAWEGQSQGFDANGNMISVSTTNLLSYDYESRLTQTLLAGASTAYQYDGDGNRMTASRAGLVTRYILDRNGPLSQVLAESDASGTITAFYVYGLGLIARIDASGNTQYYHFDSRGSTVALTDASGQTTDSYAYDPFGTPAAANGATVNRFRYLGRHGVLDETSGLNYIRARYYSARRGRFVTKDPTTGKDGDSQSLNRYVYALNNPLRLIDISGLSAQDATATLSVGGSSDSSLVHTILIETPGVSLMRYVPPPIQPTGFVSSQQSPTALSFLDVVVKRIWAGVLKTFDISQGTSVSDAVHAVSFAVGTSDLVQATDRAMTQVPQETQRNLDEGAQGSVVGRWGDATLEWFGPNGLKNRALDLWSAGSKMNGGPL